MLNAGKFLHKHAVLVSGMLSIEAVFYDTKVVNLVDYPVRVLLHTRSEDCKLEESAWVATRPLTHTL